MKIGLVGYQGSGKSTLFEWLTGVAPDPGQSHVGQSAMAEIADERVDRLAEIYQPKKVTRAALEIVDTPGLSRTHEGNAARLALIREAGCLVLVVAAFDASDPAADRDSFDEDLMLADMEILGSRIAKIEEALKKPIPRAEQEQLRHEEETLKLVLSAMESGKPLRWVRVHDLPDYAYFDHSAHVGQGVSCVSCHGRIDTMEQVYQAKPLTMSWCLDCHRNPEPHLRPQEYITQLDWEPEEDPVALGARIKESLNIHASQNCSTCHR